MIQKVTLKQRKTHGESLQKNTVSLLPPSIRQLCPEIKTVSTTGRYRTETEGHLQNLSTSQRPTGCSIADRLSRYISGVPVQHLRHSEFGKRWSNGGQHDEVGSCTFPVKSALGIHLSAWMWMHITQKANGKYLGSKRAPNKRDPVPAIAKEHVPEGPGHSRLGYLWSATAACPGFVKNKCLF